ncbi:uncharacterized protein [Watersipora subatra]|uniref:uncharacterized protein n=1 Tax=Watersipora subatra TaxID=2589382 RepID=UPI00355B56D2
MYSVSLASKDAEPMWECRCGALNVERRLRCFKCEHVQPSAQAARGGNGRNPEQAYWQNHRDRDPAYPPQFRDREELSRPWPRDPPFRRPGHPFGRADDARRPQGGPRVALDGLLEAWDDPHMPPNDRYRPGGVGDHFMPRDDFQAPHFHDNGQHGQWDDVYQAHNEPLRRRENLFGNKEWELRDQDMRGQPMRERGMSDQQMSEQKERGQGVFRNREDRYQDTSARDRYARGKERRGPGGDDSRDLVREATKPDERSSNRTQLSNPNAESAKHQQSDRAPREDRMAERSDSRSTHQRRPSQESRRDDKLLSQKRGASPDRDFNKAKNKSSSEHENKYPVFGLVKEVSAKKVEYEWQKKKAIIASLRKGGGSSSLLTGRRYRESDASSDKKDESGDSRRHEQVREPQRPSDRPAEKKPKEIYGAEVDDGSDEIGSNPSDTVLLRGLDALSDETRIQDTLADITSLAPTNCYVMRNLSTNVSLGYAFMEFDCVANGKKIVEYFNSQQPFEVDGKMLLVDFAKNTYKTIMARVDLTRDKTLAEAAAAAQKRQQFEQEQQAKLKELEVKRQKQWQLEQEEANRKMEAEKEMHKAKLEKLAKEQAEKDNFAAKFGVELYSGLTYEQETGLYTEKGQFIPERCCFVGHSMANSLDLRIFDDKEIVPNGKIDDLVTAAIKLFDHSTMKSYRICCYLFFGITDLLDVKQSQGYREVVLRTGGDTLLLSKIDWAVKTLKLKGVMVVLCTFPPMSFAKHNQFLLKNGLTGSLQHKSKYPEMQTKLNEQVSMINRRIEELNCQSGVITCQLSAKLFVQERGRYILKDIYLRDGLHPTNQGATLLNVELAQNLRKSKQGKRSPEWLQKSHQVKSASKISFGIKTKKEEPSIALGGKAFDATDDNNDSCADAHLRNQSKVSEFKATARDPFQHASRSPKQRSRSPVNQKGYQFPGHEGRFLSVSNKSGDTVEKGKFDKTTSNYDKDAAFLESKSVSRSVAQPGRMTTQGNLNDMVQSSLTQSHEVTKDRSRSRSHSRNRGQSYSQNSHQIHSRNRHRSRSRSCENRHSRSHRRSRSHSQSRKSQERMQDNKQFIFSHRKLNTPEVQWNGPNVTPDFPEKVSEFHTSRHGLHSTTDWSDQPVEPFQDHASKMWEAKSQHKPNTTSDPLFNLAKEHQALTGNSSFDQVKILSNLQQLSGGDRQSEGLTAALQFQKSALSEKLLDGINEMRDKKSKRFGELEGEMGEFERIVGSINAQARSGSYSRREQPSYGYGHASFQKHSARDSQREPWNGVSPEALQELERQRLGAGSARNVDDSYYDRGGFAGRDNRRESRGGYGGYD